MLVVVLMLDLWDFGAEKRTDPPAIISFHHSDRETCRILEDEQEHEHDFSASAFRLELKRLTGLQHVNLSSFPLRQSGEFLRITNQRWKGAVVDRNNPLGAQELYSSGCVFRPHGKVFADG